MNTKLTVALEQDKRIFGFDRERGVKLAKRTVRAFLEDLVTPVVLGDLQAAVGEAVANAIEWAAAEHITLTVFQEDDFAVFAVVDDGVGMKDVDKCKNSFYTSTPESEDHSGMGFTVIKTFSDEMDVKSTPGIGTTVLIKKRL